MSRTLLLFICFVLSISTYAQTLNSIKGKVFDNATLSALSDVRIAIKDTKEVVYSNADGTFLLSDIENGNYTLELIKAGYETEYIDVKVDNETVDLGTILLNPFLNEFMDGSVITISEEELSDDEAGGADNVAGLLQSSNDAYQQVVAFNFSQVFFKERGYDSSFGEVLFNGVPMNKYSNGRPQWSEWGGLNDMMRNDEHTMGLNASDISFGTVLGSTNYITRASKYRKGGQVSYAATNSNYDGRVMASYNTGLMENGFAISASASRRYAQEGYMEGSAYNANGFFLAVEKVFGNHAINFTGFYTPNRHGKNSPNTQEVFDLGGTTYNAYWGWQEGEKRNSRVKEIKMPTFFLNYNWDLSEQTSISTNLMYQIGTIGDSRLAYGAGSLNSDDPLSGNNPDPTYYKKLPSYYLTPGYENYQTAVDYTYKFLKNLPESQLIWNDMYLGNLNNPNGESIYSLYEDVSEDNTIAGNVIINNQLDENIRINGSLLYKKTKTEYYAHMMDLLGGEFLVDEDKFEYGTAAQNDMNNPERKVLVGDKFMYNYNVNTTQMETFLQGLFNYKYFDFFVAGNLGQTSYQREGLYKNGKFQNTSFGKGDKLDFSTFGVKGGVTYKISGRQLININGGYMEEAPAINNSFSNSRVSNITVPNLTTTKITSGDLSYIIRIPGLKARLTGYYTTMKDLTKVSYYFVQGVTLSDSDEDSEFLATALTGINTKNYGGEFGLEWQATPTVTFNGTASVGEYIYDSNPNMYVTVHEASANNSLAYSYLKNYKLSATPQRGYSLGFTYRDPNFWNIGANANLLTHNYIGLSEFRRTNNFFTDPFDGQPISGLEQSEVDAILAQEKLADVFLVNLVGGKSWKIDHYYVGFFATVNNLFGEKFKTGGFEQARKANYTELQEDLSLETPLFGNKYWYGRGTSYYINLYFRF